MSFFCKVTGRYGRNHDVINKKNLFKPFAACLVLLPLQCRYVKQVNKFEKGYNSFWTLALNSHKSFPTGLVLVRNMNFGNN